ncbi:MAG: PQQ-like beta-propeller repeat protein [Planctomycetia bacterium]|nr:PQQ-like beta-propeller repeat protein [Planctomycetia bacterium]
MRNVSKYVVLCLSTLACTARADDWPQWRGPTRDDVWRETGLIEKFAGEQVPIRWRVPVGSGYSGPSVYQGRVYLTDRIVEPAQIERVHCFDEASGKTIWSYTYDCPYAKVGYQAGPRASVGCDEGRVYALGTMGHLHCFDAAKGTVLWKHELAPEYKIDMPIWGITASPLVEGDLIIVQVGGEHACLVAFDKRTGVEKWKSVDDRASYAAPIIVEQAGKRVVVCMTGDNVVGLDPATGGVYWTVPFPPKNMPIGVSTPVVSGDRVFMTSFYDGSLLLKLNAETPTAEKLWLRVGANEKKTDALQSIIATPLFLGDYVYGVDSYGQLRCLEAKTGDRVWENITAVPPGRWSTIHLTQNVDGRTWMFNERGELIIAKLSPAGYEELSRAKLLAPTSDQLPQRGGVCWSHPAYANKRVFARSDLELVCGELAAEPAK